jgi:hypothetical protein
MLGSLSEDREEAPEWERLVRHAIDVGVDLDEPTPEWERLTRSAIGMEVHMSGTTTDPNTEQAFMDRANIQSRTVAPDTDNRPTESEQSELDFSWARAFAMTSTEPDPRVCSRYYINNPRSSNQDYFDPGKQ